MAKSNRFIVNKEILPKGKQGGVDWFNIKEIEVYFVDDKTNYILKVEDIIKDINVKILLSYDNVPYKKYLQTGQVLNGNFEILFNYFDIRGNKLRPFRLSEDGRYWIGVTHDNIEFYFNGEYSEEIMKYNWRISNGYIVTTKQKRKDIRLNRMVLGVTDRNIVVNHRGRNKMDNRVEMLSISDHEDNMKELSPSIFNNTGITGLTLNENNTYSISCSVNGFSYTSKYNTKNEALKDLLIIQHNYGYRHNENLYYILEDVNNEYVNKLIEKVKESIGNRKVNPIICKNRFELSEDKTFYYMYDKKNNRCKISIEDLELVKQGNWRIAINNGKEYFSGEVIWNEKRKGIYLHRFLFDLTNPKYRHWYIDHLDSDGLNNTRENMVITDAEGNGLNKNKNHYYMSKDNRFVLQFITKGFYYKKMFEDFDLMIEERDKIMAELMSKRLEFHSKEELDTYLLKN